MDVSLYVTQSVVITSLVFVWTYTTKNHYILNIIKVSPSTEVRCIEDVIIQLMVISSLASVWYLPGSTFSCNIFWLTDGWHSYFAVHKEVLLKSILTAKLSFKLNEGFYIMRLLAMVFNNNFITVINSNLSTGGSPPASVFLICVGMAYLPIDWS